MMILRKLACFYLLLSSPLVAKVHEYQTVRMKSTAGSGIGSILMTESALLNPASVAYFQNSSLYLQKTDFQPKDSNQPNLPDRHKEDDNDTYGLILADGSSGLSGALGYYNQEERPYYKKQFSAGFGHKIQETSSAGVGYRFSHHSSDADPKGKKTHQFIVGTNHVVNEQLTLGVVYFDPMATVPEESRIETGFQWFLKSFVAIIGDVGGDYRRGLSETFVYRGALQVSFYQDFYLRAGIYDDKALGERGNGVGASWTGPKLQIDLALKDTKPNGEEPKTGVIPSSFRETSMALSYRF